MSVEFTKDHNFWGTVKGAAVTRFPGLYVGMRRLKDIILGPLQDRLMSPYVRSLNVDGTVFLMRITNRRERWAVEGGGFEAELIGRLLNCINPGYSVFDIGAATGTHVIPAAFRTGTGVVYAFEPDLECAAGLAENVKLNGLVNVRVLPVALWREDTRLVLHTSGRRGMAARVRDMSGVLIEGFKRHQYIDARSITSLVQSGEVRTPDVLKIDVEGAGLVLLRGLGRHRPKHILMEVHPLFGENRDEIAEFLGERGYRIIWEQPRGNEIHMHFARN